jgi:MFS transporter, DHA2 family, multidrug resistance protein
VASQLPGEAGLLLARIAQDAFVDGMQVAALISVVLSIVVAIVTFIGLRHVPSTNVQPLGGEQPASPESASEQAHVTGTPGVAVPESSG